MTAGELSLIVTNVRVKTGDPGRPWATAVGIRDGKLAVVGNAAEILKMPHAAGSLLDARGQLVTLPTGLVVGSDVTVIIAADGVVAILSPESDV